MPRCQLFYLQYINRHTQSIWTIVLPVFLAVFGVTHCLEGRGREFGHDNRRGDKDERCTPVVAFDYCFVSDVGEITTEAEFEAAGDGAAKVLVARDSKSKSVFAHVVPTRLRALLPMVLL